MFSLKISKERKMGQLKFNKVEILGILVIEPRVFKDERGFFMESYNIDNFNP